MWTPLLLALGSGDNNGSPGLISSIAAAPPRVATGSAVAAATVRTTGVAPGIPSATLIAVGHVMCAITDGFGLTETAVGEPPLRNVTDHWGENIYVLIHNHPPAISGYIIRGVIKGFSPPFMARNWKIHCTAPSVLYGLTEVDLICQAFFFEIYDDF